MPAGAPAIVNPAPWGGVTYTPPLPTDLDTVEQAIVKQLAANVPLGVIVEGFPADLKNYRKRGAAGTVLVRYAGDRYGERLSTEAISQWRTQQWDVLIVSRNLGWKYGGVGDQGIGAYGLTEIVRLALLGFRIPGFKKAYAINGNFDDYEAPYWSYVNRYAFETLVVEKTPVVLNPLFIKGLAIDAAGQTVRAVPTAALTFNGADQILLGQQNVSAVTVSNTGTGAVYVAGSDYSVDTVNGVITRLATGTIVALQTVNVSFSHSDVITALASGGAAPTYPTN